MNIPALITCPAQPIQGGRLELAPRKRGLWFAEPKLNGWHALIHTPISRTRRKLSRIAKTPPPPD